MLVCPPTGAQAAFPYSYFKVYQNPTGRMSENVRLCPFLFVLMREKLKNIHHLPQFSIPSDIYLQDNKYRMVNNNIKQKQPFQVYINIIV